MDQQLQQITKVIGDATAYGTITGANIANTWTLNDDSCTVTGLSDGFTNIANLVGGTADDSFVFESAGVIDEASMERSVVSIP